MTAKYKQLILGIESSCDETSAAIIKVENNKFSILSNIISSQIKIHQQYGGVVPEVAARNHVINIIPVVQQALMKARVTPKEIGLLATTAGPGLITSLMVGLETSKTLAYTWQKPIVPVNHMKGHIYANWFNNKKISFPAIALIVSGGHTELILMKNKTNFKKIGQTVDDAAGEAFDKVAQLLNIGYPGGPIVSKLALDGDPKSFALPRPMIDNQNFNFSFSGLKTAVLYTVKKIKKLDDKIKADICASFQQAVVDVLTLKTIKAAKHYKAKTIILAGGVAANKLLRESLSGASEKEKINFSLPEIILCTDNAAMIAAAGYFGKPQPWQKIKVDPNLEIK